MRSDARIAVRLVSPDEMPDRASDAVLVRIGAESAEKPAMGEDGAGWAAVLDLPDASIAPHAAGCRCCSGRTGLSDALALLFARRARMELPFFTRVVVQAAPDRIHDLVTILRQDDTISGRFRREP